MTESPIVNEWIEQASRESRLQEARELLIRQMHKRFPGQVTPEVIATINSQPSRAVLHDWAEELVVVLTFNDFLAHMRR